MTVRCRVALSSFAVSLFPTSVSKRGFTLLPPFSACLSHILLAHIKLAGMIPTVRVLRNIMLGLHVSKRGLGLKIVPAHEPLLNPITGSWLVKNTLHTVIVTLRSDNKISES